MDKKRKAFARHPSVITYLCRAMFIKPRFVASVAMALLKTSAIMSLFPTHEHGAAGEKRAAESPAPSAPAPNYRDIIDQLADLRLRASIYRSLLTKHASALSLQEQRSLDEFKALIEPDNPAILLVKRMLLADYARDIVKSPKDDEPPVLNYSYEHHFPQMARRAFECVSALRDLKPELPFAYWLPLKDVWEMRGGEPAHKAVFLCSLLIALQCQCAKVRVLELQGGARYPIVTAAFGSQDYVFDVASRGAGFYIGRLSDTLRSVSFDGQKASRSLYEFNPAGYSELNAPV